MAIRVVYAKTVFIGLQKVIRMSTKRSPKMTVQLLLQIVENVLETITKRNVRNMRYILTELDQSDILKISKTYIKKNLHFVEM